MAQIFEGKAWLAGNDIDTDQIYHGQYLPLTDPKEMAKHAMEYVPGMENFVKEVQSGDILVTGKNFGCGSSREHAVLCLLHNGVSIIIAESFARIFYRNAVNLAMPVLVAEGINKFIHQGDKLKVNIETGQIENLTQSTKMQGTPLSGLERELAEKGGLLNYLKTKKGIGK